MLPMMILQANEFTTFDSRLNSSGLLPQQALEPRAAFADVLELGFDVARDVGQSDGMPLPQPGKDLPQAAPEFETPAPVESGDVVTMLPLTAPAPDQSVAPGVAKAGSVSGIAIPRPAPVSSPPAAQQPQLTANAGLETGSIGPQRPNGNEEVLRDITAVKMAAPDPAPRHIPARERSPGEVVRDLPAIAVAGKTASDSSDRRVPAKLRPASNAVSNAVSRTVANANGPVRQITDIFRDAAPRDIKQPGTAPVARPAPLRLTRTNPIEMPVGQQAQIGSLQPTLTPAAVSIETVLPTAQLTQRIDVPVNEAAWGDRIGERVLLMASNKLQSAEIRLTPAELGPLRIQVAVEDGAANVTFHAQHASTREALDQALPRLRELFAENGLTLDQTSIGEPGDQEVQHEDPRQGEDMFAGADTPAESGADPASEESNVAQHLENRSNNLVDTFA